MVRDYTRLTYSLEKVHGAVKHKYVENTCECCGRTFYSYRRKVITCQECGSKVITVHFSLPVLEVLKGQGNRAAFIRAAVREKLAREGIAWTTRGA